MQHFTGNQLALIIGVRCNANSRAGSQVWRSLSFRLRRASFWSASETTPDVAARALTRRCNRWSPRLAMTNCSVLKPSSNGPTGPRDSGQRHGVVRVSVRRKSPISCRRAASQHCQTWVVRSQVRVGGRINWLRKKWCRPERSPSPRRDSGGKIKSIGHGPRALAGNRATLPFGPGTGAG